jgi:hypothetical protein
MDLTHTAFPFRLSVAFAIALSDWLVFALNLAGAGKQFWAINLSGAGLALVTCWLIEGENGEHFSWHRALHALAAALIVVVPFPVLGTLTAALALTWSLMHNVLQRRGARIRAH